MKLLPFGRQLEQVLVEILVFGIPPFQFNIVFFFSTININDRCENSFSNLIISMGHHPGLNHKMWKTSPYSFPAVQKVFMVAE
jgi:hypothetical protein